MKTRMGRFAAAASAKLKSRAGDTFVEVLAAGLIIVLGIAMAVAMISTSSRLVMNADKAQNDYYEQRNLVENMDTSLTSADLSMSVSMQAVAGDTNLGTIDIRVYTYKDASGTAVLSYFEKR